MKKKILLSFLSIVMMFGIVSNSKVIGVGLKYNVGVNIDSTGALKNYVYRTYTTASIATKNWWSANIGNNTKPWWPKSTGTRQFNSNNIYKHTS